MNAPVIKKLNETIKHLKNLEIPNIAGRKKLIRIQFQSIHHIKNLVKNIIDAADECKPVSFELVNVEKFTEIDSFNNGLYKGNYI
jgi:uncharacterized Fe-S cluster-containing MiaB family protein